MTAGGRGGGEDLILVYLAFAVCHLTKGLSFPPVPAVLFTITLWVFIFRQKVSDRSLELPRLDAQTQQKKTENGVCSLSVITFFLCCFIGPNPRPITLFILQLEIETTFRFQDVLDLDKDSGFRVHFSRRRFRSQKQHIFMSLLILNRPCHNSNETIQTDTQKRKNMFYINGKILL